jgi:hypothetical protein
MIPPVREAAWMIPMISPNDLVPKKEPIKPGMVVIFPP